MVAGVRSDWFGGVATWLLSGFGLSLCLWWGGYNTDLLGGFGWVEWVFGWFWVGLVGCVSWFLGGFWVLFSGLGCCFRLFYVDLPDFGQVGSGFRFWLVGFGWFCGCVFLGGFGWCCMVPFWIDLRL